MVQQEFFFNAFSLCENKDNLLYVTYCIISVLPYAQKVTDIKVILRCHVMDMYDYVV
jgi:hypothetical protein